MIQDGYSICLNEWALDPNIKNELNLLLIISSLTAEQGYCYASNSYFAELFKIDEVSVSRKIKKLSDCGYISIEYAKQGCQITERKLRLTKMLIHDLQKNQSTINKNVKDNNISIKNINNNNICPQSNSGFGLGTITQNEEQECDNTPIAKQTEDKSKNLFFGKTEDELIENTIYNWNIIANKYDFPRIQTITKPRLAKLKARIKQSGGIKEFWTILQDSIDDSKFLMYGNDTWKCNFDFVLQESSFVKIMEHQYK